ncbi:hypothetical protein Athai_37500 [Actinocatenispora thailandica]|uniref:Uncharacterized protein n=1 Tax=Actinocatenispora thailandica TaxID=227318 RepID=A0A7R7HXJ5_9ACTN|nr:hypothetical protein [Actinocatenispora thailandica]BCJ36247.1 hypothetical protein Athai_37500 [Actinocatenispora thailandica]
MSRRRADQPGAVRQAAWSTPRPTRAERRLRKIRRRAVQRSAAQRARESAGASGPRRPRWPIVVGIGLIVSILVATWSDLTLLVSPYRSVVDTLRQHVVYVQPGAGHVDTAAIRRAIGVRPIAVEVLEPGSAQAKDPGKACAAAVDRIDGLMVAVFVGGEFEYGCESDDLPLTVDWFGWDFVQWSVVSTATGYLTGDVAAQVNQVVLRYDANIADGSLLDHRRRFSVPTYRYLVAGGLVVLVVAGVFGVRAGLGRTVRVAARALVRRARRRARYAELDGELAEVALIMVELSPEAAGVAADRLGRLSADYLTALADSQHADRHTDLDELADRIGRLRERARALDAA